VPDAFAIGVIVGVALGAVVIIVSRLVERRSATAGAAPLAGAPSAAAATATPMPATRRSGLRVERAGSRRLPRFDEVGGNDELKEEMHATVGLLLQHAEEADDYGISWNGLLFHGPPGTGKSFFARAIAGELGMSYIDVDTVDLVTSAVGGGPERVEAAFELAEQHLPCVLFFDEIDAVAQHRGGMVEAGGGGREVLTQLLQSLEEHHGEPRLVVAAATNDVGSLDPAVTRPGRFDRIIRMDLPDDGARAAIFRAALADRPCARLDVDECARRTKGLTAAGIVRLVEAAALAAFREKIGTGKAVRISMAHLTSAIEHRAGKDRPTVEDWSWDRLVLPADVLAELRQLQRLIEDPEAAYGLGIDPPTGVLLTGPPGTGKTTIAKVLAAEAACSFYPVSGADVTSKWVGDSERAIARLFARARDNAPSIVFIDEIDAIASTRGDLQTYDRQLDQLLQEMDGLAGHQGVTVLAATNRARSLDPAILRGGRLSRVIEIPLPDGDARLAILRVVTARMPLDGVDLEALALETEGFSGADLKALCQQAAVESLVRTGARAAKPAKGSRHVTAADFDQALADRPTKWRRRSTRSAGAGAAED
jgi:transitional endoplasmic reticulum ATPase